MAATIIDSSGVSHYVTRAIVHESISGPWLINGRLQDSSSAVSGACVFRYGGAEWRGTIDPEFSGEWGTAGAFRLLAGGGGWGKKIKRKSYHSDSGVKGRTVATDAARACGETLGTFQGEGSLGVDYARPSGTASVALEDAAGFASWWVGRDGITQVGTRISSPVSRVLDWDPERHIATLEADELDKLEVGAKLVDSRLVSELVIRDLEVRISSKEIRAYAWCPGTNETIGRMPRLLKAIVNRIVEGKLYGKYRYRVVSMAPDGRVNLQVVGKDTIVPDVLPVTQWPGVAGAFAKLANGAEVLVEFIEGDRDQPIITHYTPLGQNGFKPISLALLEGKRPAAGVGNSVKIFSTVGTPVQVAGTMNGQAFVGTAVFSVPLEGIIMNGTPEVLIP